MTWPKWALKLFSAVRALKASTKGGLTARGAAGLAVGFVVAAITIPIGLDEIYSANTTLWEDAVTTMFTILLPILFIIAVSLRMLGKG